MWNVDDDADYESNNQSFTHTYENAGTYDISLIVNGAGGQSTMVEEDAIIISEPDTSTETGLLSKTMSYDNETREYLIYIPSSYDPNSTTPVLFAFHGFGGYNQYFINTADFRALADQFNFIAVYPQGLVCNDGTTWNTNPPGGDNKCSQDDIGFFAALLSEISSNYTIDSNRIYQNSGDINLSGANSVFLSGLLTDNLTVNFNTIRSNQSNETISLEPSGTGTVEMYSDWNSTGNIHATGNITFGGDLVLGDDDTDSVVFNSDLNSDLLPDVNDVSELGTSSKRWNNIYVKIPILIIYIKITV